MLRKRKCQAKPKENCTDPNCPEQMYLKTAFAEAIKNKDFDSFINAKLEEKNLEPQFIRTSYNSSEEWDRLVVKDKASGNLFSSPVTPLVREKYSRDINVIQHFDEWATMERALSEKGLITLRLNKSDDSYAEESLQGFYIADFYVSPKLRGQGVGQHIMTTMTQHADENNLVMELVPTNAGDGKLSEEQKGFTEAALAHRARLIKFYERQGFQLNPFYRYSGRRDYLTKEPYIIDEAERARYTAKAARVLSRHSMYIRYPQGKMPKGWLKPVSKSA
jgi:GNAT superfamily N-acetyltransferase